MVRKSFKYQLTFVSLLAVPSTVLLLLSALFEEGIESSATAPHVAHVTDEVRSVGSTVGSGIPVRSLEQDELSGRSLHEEETADADESKDPEEEGEDEEGKEKSEDGKEHGEEEGKDKGEEKKPKKEFNKVDLAISCMLLGFVTFIMGLFSVVNVEDEDMRLYAWQVISATISIFIAVLMFSSLNSILHVVLLKGCPKAIHAVGDGGQMMMSYLMLQVSVAYISGGLEKTPFKAPRAAGDPSIEEQKAHRELHMKCVATLLAHTTGFASINFGGAMQHGEFFEKNPWATFLVVPGMYFGQLTLQTTVLIIRNKVMEYNKVTRPEGGTEMQPLENGGAGTQESEEELGAEYAADKWEDEVFESENDIAGLQVSFLTVQACRFNITGVLPNNLGVEMEEFIHPWWCSAKLFGLSFLFVVFTMIFVLILENPPLNAAGKKLSFIMTIVQKMVLVMVNATSMAFAWCQLYIFKWEIIKWFPQLHSPNTLTCAVLLAMSITCVAFTAIFALDKIADSPITGEAADHVIFSIINALGILVGFSWEQSFDDAVECVAALTPNPIAGEMVLAIMVVIVVIEPWRRYILKTVIILEEEREKHEEEEKEKDDEDKQEEEEEEEGSEYSSSIDDGEESPAPMKQ
eukprot:gnl/TRDRNA2_/TRDRNA2_177001_c2_seq8.p1 gnl/TRDRNA2_/TRDRNA2_177001_c2~~gnl/TRDRNA2_/TRDRNA2_177001_c2_seq8.p1  ORF type:complete len:633 (+),score=160.33 gnl/TRDRNA2_/TRDRNA2_177001_c2_seq8:40-1938(+)